MRQFTPENITELKADEVFVFGSNMAGNHAGDCGAANAGDCGAAIVSTGGKVKGGYGCVLVARNFALVDGKVKVVDWAAAIVDGVTIKADTWYRLEDGKFVECDEQ